MNEPDAIRPKPPSYRGVRLALPWLAALLILLVLHVWFPRIDVEPLNDTWSADVGGRSAFYQFADRRWPDVTRNLEPLYRSLDYVDSDAVLCVLGPARYPTPREWKALLTWVEEGGTLLFAAQWDDPEVEIPDVAARVRSLEGKKTDKKVKSEKEGPGTGDRGTGKGDGEAKKDSPNEESEEKRKRKSDKEGADEKSSKAKPIADPGLAIETSLLPANSVRWRSRGFVDAPGAESLVKTAWGEQVVRVRHGAGTIVLCASDQIFSNVALTDRERENALLAVRLLEAAGSDRPIVFDESLNATGTPRVVGLLLDPHLRPVTLQILVVLVVFGWRGGRRFGGLLPSDVAPRHNLADHTDSLGNLYWKAKNGQGALRSYLDQLRRQLRLPATAGRDLRALAPLAARCGVPVEEVQQLLAQAESAAARENLNRRDAAHFIRRLARLRTTSPPIDPRRSTTGDAPANRPAPSA